MIGVPIVIRDLHAAGGTCSSVVHANYTTSLVSDDRRWQQAAFVVRRAGAVGDKPGHELVGHAANKKAASSVSEMAFLLVCRKFL